LHEHLVQNYIQKQAANIDLLYGYQVGPVDFGSDIQSAVKVQITKCEDIQCDVEEDEEETTTTNSKGDTSKVKPIKKKKRKIVKYEASQDSQQICNVDEYVMATTNFLIGADGAARTVASAMEAADQKRVQKMNPLRRLVSKPFRITEFQDDNPRVYKSVPLILPSNENWPTDLNYSCRSRNSRIVLEALPSDDKGSLCALLLMRPDDELAQPNVDPQKLRQFFDEEFPQFSRIVDDDEMQRVAQKPASRLPVFRYAGPKLHLGHRTLVMGDAAHTVKPYFGLGANTALEDVQALSDILQEHAAAEDPIPLAVKTFSDRRAGDAEALVKISRNMDRPGGLFFVCFILPIILDKIFHILAPAIVSFMYLKLGSTRCVLS